VGSSESEAACGRRGITYYVLGVVNVHYSMDIERVGFLD
jgi:hypothetical protein